MPFDPHTLTRQATATVVCGDCAHMRSEHVHAALTDGLEELEGALRAAERACPECGSAMVSESGRYEFDEPALGALRWDSEDGFRFASYEVSDEDMLLGLSG